MKTSQILTCLSAGLLVASASGQAPPRDANSPSWWQAEMKVITLQMHPNADYANLVRAVKVLPTRTAQDAMFKLCVFMGAGMKAESRAAVKDLKTQCPKIEEERIDPILRSACGQIEDWETAQALVEAYADCILTLPLDHHLLKGMIEAGWSVQDVDRWLADRAQSVPTRDLRYVECFFHRRRATAENFWFDARLRFDISHGLGEARIQELAATARALPTENWRTMDLLEALHYAQPLLRSSVDLAWLPKTVKPALATEAYGLADLLGKLDLYDLAVGYAEQAATTALTPEEVRSMGLMVSGARSEESLRSFFAAEAADRASEHHLKLDHKSRSKEWMVKANDIRTKHKLGRDDFDFNAPVVQVVSVPRIVDGRIQQGEHASKSDPEYWLERARYFSGRQEPKQEEAALVHAWALVQPQPKPEHATKMGDERSRVLQDYIGFLGRQDRADQAVAMLRSEIEKYPNAASAESAVWTIAEDFGYACGVDDPVLWGWLARRPVWDLTDQKLLSRLICREERCLARAEKLAVGADSSRALLLGEVLMRIDQPQRAIPQLRSALERLTDKYARRSATTELYQAYLDVGDYKSAEKMQSQLTSCCVGTDKFIWLITQTAGVAAKAGAKADAMRLWRRAVHLGPANLGYLDEMAKHGLNQELIDFYYAMKSTLPESDVPTRAFAILGRHRW